MATMAQTIKVELEEDAYRLALGHFEAVEDAPRIGRWREVTCTRNAAQDMLVLFLKPLIDRSTVVVGRTIPAFPFSSLVPVNLSSIASIRSTF